MSVNQLAKQLDKTPQAIYHQIKKLTDAGMVEVEREERSGHLMEAYYRATAEVFNFQHGEPGTSKLDPKIIKPILQSLVKLGLASRVDEEIITEVAQLQGQLYSIAEDVTLEQRIEQLDDVDSITKQALLEYSKIMSMTDEEFRNYIQVYSRIRDLLKSTSKIQKPPQQIAR